jgi:hypothetical protein
VERDKITPMKGMSYGVHLSVQKEYFNYSKSIDFNNIDYKEVFKESSKLFSENTPVETKRRILILLAHFGTPESYRILEKYLKSSEQNLRDRALLSLKEFLFFHYYVTNVKKPTNEEILEYLQQIRHG